MFAPDTGVSSADGAALRLYRFGADCLVSAQFFANLRTASHLQSSPLMPNATVTSFAEQTAAAKEAAKMAGLRYVSDQRPGIQRRRAGKGFRYLDVNGRPLRDAAALQRIKALAIPPAWTEVWICPQPNGHLQATGRDAKGRKQYRYHARWRSVRDETKFDRMLSFGQALPLIRARTEEDLRLPGLPRAKVQAALVRLLETTFIRIGNEEYARTNRSFGLTTLRDSHVEIKGADVRFQFRGKSGVRHTVSLSDRRLARIVKRCQDLPGQVLFQYLDEAGQPQSIGSAEVNEYLREITREDFTAKDFRTWAGTVLAAFALQQCPPCNTQAELKHNIVEALKTVAARLGNTPAVCRKSYVHPAILELYGGGELSAVWQASLTDGQSHARARLKPAEAAVLRLLRQTLNGAAATERAA
jgi:DNA topoisomerase-1